ncbi:MAG: alkaline phosphatase D family protein [Cryomorphaceae bacterium]|nr:alkaline phosphatase family protein [Flavobacteriales bacterium]
MKHSIFYLAIVLGSFFSCTNKPPSVNEDLRTTHIWCGAVDTSSAKIGIVTSHPAKARIAFSTDSTLRTETRYSKPFHTDSLSGYGTVDLDSLKSGSMYYYRAVLKDSIVGPLGKFRTPNADPMDFQFVFASCMRTGSESEIFRTMAEAEPLFFLNTGDFHYENIKDNCDENFRNAYRSNWNSNAQAELFRVAPFIYMWDDHDYGPNNSAGDAPCRTSALDAYRKYVPHYPTAFDSKNGPVSQSFKMGRVRFILADLRSQKIEPKYNGCERISMGSNFGTEEHINWFLNELLLAKQRRELVVWVSGIPFINHYDGPNYDCDEDDDWGGYPEERRRISNFIARHHIPVCILSGDAHMSAIDDGSNSNYADSSSTGIPVFHAGPMHEKPSYKGGPYSHGYSAKPYQFGVMRVKDNGGKEICVEWEARDIEGNPVKVSLQNETRTLAYSFCRDLTSGQNESTEFKSKSDDN